jgi:diadenosine tetraphosphatase ApaH/serine/threonine PP2A family protein phosphatase
LGCKVVKGNHDHYCSHPDVDLDDFQPNAASVIEWTRRNISDDDTEWLHNLPLSLKFAGFTFVHSTLDSPANFRYAFTKEDALDSFLAQGTRVCFHGHTHVPCIFRCRPGGKTCHDVDKLNAADGRLDPGNYFINVGSVGQPRDGDPRACYVIFDAHSLNDLEIQFRRVDYDVEAAIAHIQHAGLPDRLVQRLYTGM